MENPASWTETTHAIQKAINDHKAAQDAGAIGGSLAMYIETVVFEPRMTILTQERDGLRDNLRNAVEYFELVLAHKPLPLTFTGQLNAYRAALAAGPRGEETND